jgi:hypothetical protein
VIKICVYVKRVKFYLYKRGPNFLVRLTLIEARQPGSFGPECFHPWSVHS